MPSLSEPLLSPREPSHGVLYAALSALALYTLCTSETVRTLVLKDFSVLGATLLVALLCSPTLWLTSLCLYQYVSTIAVRPNSGRLDWTWIAFVYGVLTTLFTFLLGFFASWTVGNSAFAPLVGAFMQFRIAPNATMPLPHLVWSLFANISMPGVEVLVDDGTVRASQYRDEPSRRFSYGETEPVDVFSPSELASSAASRTSSFLSRFLATLPATVPLYLPSSLTLEPYRLPEGGLELHWWTAGAALGIFVLCTFFAQQLGKWLAMGCGGGPAMWRCTRVLNGKEGRAEMERLREYVARACATQSSKYNFGLELRDAWRVSNSHLDAAYEALAAARSNAGMASNRRLLFHGTPIENAHAILSEGFRLPAHAGMFGRGIYFADCPLKSLQYTSPFSSVKTMLVCEVELGNPMKVKTARSNLDPTSQLYDEGFDSVAASASWGGLRVPEFVIYRREQCVPRYILAVRQVPAKSQQALRPSPMSDNVDWTQICQRNVKHTLGERLARDARQESAADLELGEAPSSSDAPAMASRPRSVDVVGEVEGCLDAADGDAGGFLANGSLIHRPTGSGEGKRELLMCYDERTMTLVFYCALHPKKPIDAIVPTSRQQSRSFLADASGSSLACDNARNAHNSFSEYVSLVDAVGLEHVRSVEPTSNTSLDRKEGCNIALTVYYAPRRTGGPSSFFSWLGNTATTTIRLVRLDGESLEEMSQRRDRILFILRSLMLRMPTRFAKREVPRSGTWIIDEVTLAARPKLRNEEIRRMLGRPKGLREEFSEICERWRGLCNCDAMRSGFAEFTQGSRLEVALKLICVPIALPIVLAVMLVWRGVPALLSLCLLSILTAFRLVTLAWVAVLNLVAAHAKALVFAIYDRCLAPILRVVHTLVVRPLQAGGVAAVHALLPILAAVAHAASWTCINCIRLLRVACKGLTKLDELVSSAFVGSITLVWNVVLAFQKCLKDICGGCCEQTTEFLLACWRIILSTFRILGSTLGAILRFVWRQVFWLLSWIASTVATLIRAFFSAVFAVAKALSHVLTPMFQTLYGWVLILGHLLWTGTTATASALFAAVSASIRVAVALVFAILTPVTRLSIAIYVGLLVPIGRGMLSVAQTIAGVILTVIGAVAAAVGLVAHAISTLIGGVFQTVSGVVIAVANVVGAVAAAVGRAVGAVIDAVVEVVVAIINIFTGRGKGSAHGYGMV